ncbi:MAG: hypothetical protein ACJAUP_003862 [Cellvibrionaceae bacterium]
MPAPSFACAPLMADVNDIIDALAGTFIIIANQTSDDRAAETLNF